MEKDPLCSEAKLLWIVVSFTLMPLQVPTSLRSSIMCWCNMNSRKKNEGKGGCIVDRRRLSWKEGERKVLGLRVDGGNVLALEK